MADKDEVLDEDEVEVEAADEADDESEEDDEEEADEADGESEEEDEEDGEDDDEAPVAGSGRSRRPSKSRKDDKSAKRSRAYTPQGKSQSVALLLGLFLGFLGADRFYIGRIPLGATKLAFTIIAAVLLLIDPLTLGLEENVASASAAAYILLVLVVGLQVYDFVLIGMGRMRDKEGKPLDDGTAPDAERSKNKYWGRTFLLASLCGYIGLDRFYLESKVFGGIKLGITLVGLLLLLLAMPYWAGVRDYPLVAWFTLKENMGAPEPIEKEIVVSVVHHLVIKRNPTLEEEKQAAEKNQAYFARVKELGAVEAAKEAAADDSIDTDDDGNKEKEGETDESAAAGKTGDTTAGDDDDKAEKEEHATQPRTVTRGSSSKKLVWFDGKSPRQFREDEMYKARQKMWFERAEGKAPLLGITANIDRFPIQSRARQTLLQVAYGVLGLAFLAWLADVLLAGMGKLKDDEGKPLKTDPLLTTIHCMACHEQMVVDLFQPNLGSIICRYEQCGRISAAPDAETIERLTRLRDKALAHTILALVFCGATMASLLGLFYAYWPDTLGEFSDLDIDDAGNVFMLAIAITFIITIIHAVMAERSKSVCEF